MKLNKDCIRAVLIYIEEHCIYEEDKGDNKTMHIVNLHELLESKEISDFKEDDIRYTIVKLLEGDYIKGSLIPKNNGTNIDIAVRISQLTLRGHELLDNIRIESVWNKTKRLLERVGDFSLNTMSQIAKESMVVHMKSMVNPN